MKTAIKKRWTQALRSGQYKQCTDQLTDGKGFCCLGVLCNLHALETGRAWERSKHGISYLGRSGALPQEVCDWAGLESDDGIPNVTYEDEFTNLACLNDANGLTFKQIATVINKNF